MVHFCSIWWSEWSDSCKTCLLCPWDGVWHYAGIIHFIGRCNLHIIRLVDSGLFVSNTRFDYILDSGKIPSDIDQKALRAISISRFCLEFRPKTISVPSKFVSLRHCSQNDVLAAKGRWKRGSGKCWIDNDWKSVRRENYKIPVV